MLKFALVGCGGMANWHAQQLKAIEDCQVAALVDICPPNTAAYAEKYFPKAEQFESYDAMLAKLGDQLDGVVLVTPHADHYPQIKMALQRGINVLTEKPMVTSSAHAIEIAQLVKKSGKKLGITFQAPYSPEFGYLATERNAGRLGTMQVISGMISQNWLTLTKSKWRQDPAISGGGQMYDTGAHIINGILWIMNEPAVEVACFDNKCGTPVDINGVAIIKFQSGALASLAIGGNCPMWNNDIIFQTDKMMFTTASHGGKLDMKVNGRTIYPHVTSKDHPAAHTPHLNFVNALLGKEELVVPVRYGVMLSLLMDAMYESANTGRVVKVKAMPAEIS